ncbi:MAG: class I SAM-dependent methyltransferase [Acidobacteriota bacterium]
MSGGSGRQPVRTVENGRLLWWQQEADDAYWFEKFDSAIASSHRAADEGRLGRIGELLAGALPRNGAVLEAGSGTGWVVAGLRARGFDIEGVEHSARLVEAVRRHRPRLPIRQGDVRALEKPDGSYDGYVSLGVVEHFRDGCGDFLREAERLLAPGGVLCLSVPHFNGLRRLKAALGLFRGEPGDLPFYQYAFTRRGLERLLAPYAFEIERFAGYGAARCLEKELPGAYARMLRTPGLWRLPRWSERLDRTGLVSHMILAIARRAA